jgi:hypothetical protein
LIFVAPVDSNGTVTGAIIGVGGFLGVGRTPPFGKGFYERLCNAVGCSHMSAFVRGS